MEVHRKRRPVVTYGKSSARKRPLDDAFSSLSFEDRDDEKYFTNVPSFLSPNRETMKDVAEEGQRVNAEVSATSRQTSANKNNSRSIEQSRIGLEQRKSEKASSQGGVFDVPSSEDEVRVRRRTAKPQPRPRLIRTTTDTSRNGAAAIPETAKEKTNKRLPIQSPQGKRDPQVTEGNNASVPAGGPSLKPRHTAPQFTSHVSSSAPVRRTRVAYKAPEKEEIAKVDTYELTLESSDDAEFAPVPTLGKKTARSVENRQVSHKITQKPISREDSEDGKAMGVVARRKRFFAESVTVLSKVKTPIRTAPSMLNSTSGEATASLLFDSPEPRARWFADTHEADFTLRVDESIWDAILDDQPPQKKKSVTRNLRIRPQGDEITHNPSEALLPPKTRLIHGLKDQDIEDREDSDQDGMEIGNDDQTSSQAQSTSESQIDSMSNSQECAMSLQQFNLVGDGGTETAGFMRRAGPSITYARQRSFLTEEVKDGGDAFTDPLLLPARDFGSKFHLKPMQQNLEDEEEEDVAMMKSLHELREAGVNKRFVDTVEGLFEDIEGDVALGRRRAGYLELATKLRDKNFLHKFRANNFDRRLLSYVEKETDDIIQFILGFIIWCLLHEDPALHLIRNSGITPMLIRMLDADRDIKAIAKDRKMNMSKAAQSLVGDFCAALETSSMFRNRKPKSLSPRLMALEVLDIIMRKLRQSGWMDEYLPQDGLKKLIGILSQFTNSKKDSANIKSVDPLLLELPVSILESYSIGRHINPEAELSVLDIRILANLLEGTIELDYDGIKPIQLLLLRLGINLTNGRPDVCELYADSSIIPLLIRTTQTKFEALSGFLEEDQRLLELDMLVLSLALMINFAELSEEARAEFSHQGSFVPSPLETLLKLFLDRLEKTAEAQSMEESQSNVAFGYLSILLGNLCQSPSLRKTVRSQMPNKKLQPLIDAVHEFVVHNRKVDEERRAMMDLDGAEESEAEGYHRGFTDRLETVAIDLRGYGS